ncbi:hypothetical protein X975_19817, partial [Stegodyphus mimosarum]
MGEQLRQFISAFAAFKEEIKVGQDSVQEEMKAVQEKMEAGQDSVKEEMKAVQEKMDAGQVSVNEEMKAIQEKIEADSSRKPETRLRSSVRRFGAVFWREVFKRLQQASVKILPTKPTETLQELATYVERLSHVAFSECPTETREILSLQYFIDGIRDSEIQKVLRMVDVKDIKNALVYAMKFEAAQQTTRRDQQQSELRKSKSQWISSLLI